MTEKWKPGGEDLSGTEEKQKGKEMTEKSETVEVSVEDLLAEDEYCDICCGRCVLVSHEGDPPITERDISADLDLTNAPEADPMTAHDDIAAVRTLADEVVAYCGKWKSPDMSGKPPSIEPMRRAIQPCLAALERLEKSIALYESVQADIVTMVHSREESARRAALEEAAQLAEMGCYDLLATPYEQPDLSYNDGKMDAEAGIAKAIRALADKENDR